MSGEARRLGFQLVQQNLRSRELLSHLSLTCRAPGSSRGPRMINRAGDLYFGGVGGNLHSYKLTGFRKPSHPLPFLGPPRLEM